MPELSRFYGISISMYFEDHNPPHFHAKYNDYESIIDIDTGNVLKGNLPSKQLRLVVAWVEIHRDELMDAWGKCRNLESVCDIAPLQ